MERTTSVRLGRDLSVFYTPTGIYPIPGADGCSPTVCVSSVWAGVDKVWEQEKLEARKMLENASESHRFTPRCVRRLAY